MLKIENEQEDDGRWVAEVPALSGVFVYGQTKAAANVRAKALRCASLPTAWNMASRCLGNLAYCLRQRKPAVWWM